MNIIHRYHLSSRGHIARLARLVRVSPRPYPNATVSRAGLGPEPTAIPLALPRLDIAPASAGYRAADLAVYSCRGSSE
jgi:hypothetical protein